MDTASVYYAKQLTFKILQRKNYFCLDEPSDI